MTKAHLNCLFGFYDRWDFIREGKHMQKDMDRLVAYEKGLMPWARWVDTNVDPKKTKVFIQGVSPDHSK